MPDARMLERRISEILRDRLNLSVPSADTDLIDTGVLDSLSFVGLLLELETEFGLTISLADLELDNFRSIARIAAFIASAAGSAPPERADYGRSIGGG